jgi:hypothetical protein
MRNIISYKEGASFVSLGSEPKLNTWEDNITFGKGLSYGTEVLLQKDFGRLTGWLGYTLSWTVHQFKELNNGNAFFPRHDRRHDLSLVLNYKLSPKITLSANWLFASGNSLTAPQGYYFGNADFAKVENQFSPQYTNPVSYFGSRNSFRAENYHRLDLSIQFHKTKKWGERTWEFGLYNAYFRKNPYQYYLDNKRDGQQTLLTRKYLFPFLPSVTYRFKF